MDGHFVSVNYNADTSNDTSSTSEPHLQIHDVRISAATSNKRLSILQPKVTHYKFLAMVGVLFILIIASFSIPVVLYYTQDRLDLSMLTAHGNNSLVSLFNMRMHVC